MTKERRKTWVSTADSDYYPTGAEDEHTKYCIKCESYGFLYQPLGERIYQDHELINGQPPHDASQWLQCYRCGTITPSMHGKQEGRIKPFIEVPESIHDTQRLKIEHFIEPRRKNKRGNKKTHNENSTGLPDVSEDKDLLQLTGSVSGRELANYSDSTN